MGRHRHDALELVVAECHHHVGDQGFAGPGIAIEPRDDVSEAGGLRG
jgi:hypothetical protein